MLGPFVQSPKRRRVGGGGDGDGEFLADLSEKVDGLEGAVRNFGA